MNRTDFLRMIEISGPSDRSAIGEVNELLNIFPYFQSAYLLMLKGLQNTADVKFENQLRTSAMRVADREVLYYLLKREPDTEKIIEIPVQKPVPPLADTADLQQTVIDSAKNSQDFINEIEKELTRESEGTSTEHSIFITEETNDDESEATIIIIDSESGFVEEKITYMDPGFSVAEPTELLELEAETAVPAETVKKPDSKRKLQSELIDKFIIENPRIEPRKEKSDLPNVDISTPYVEERDSFVTETLARIYINQGYYSRAIEIYEKLSLKFPEKSSYFASQIEKVKELIKK